MNIYLNYIPGHYSFLFYYRSAITRAASIFALNGTVTIELSILSI